MLRNNRTRRAVDWCVHFRPHPAGRQGRQQSPV